MSEEHFKEVLGHYVTGVAVVTGVTPAGPAGFTCQTFGSLSLHPTLVSFAATAESRTWPQLRESGVVGLNILSDEQELLARIFATSGVDKFEGVTWTSAPSGSPYLSDVIARLEGRIVSVATHGDHDIAVVEVSHLESFGGEPLVYFRGGYRRLD